MLTTLLGRLRSAPPPQMQRRGILLAAVLLLAGCGRRTPPTAPPRPPSAAAGPGAIQFEDVAARAGITYVYPRQPRPMRNLDSIGCGCAAFDYDDDGWMDILLVTAPHPILYRNRHDGTFEDVTAATGLDKLHGDWKGCAIGDYDGDGKLDILLTGYRCLALLRNEARGDRGDRETSGQGDKGRREASGNPQSAIRNSQFRDVTRAAGLDPTNHGRWGTSAGFMDLDGSGRLALVLLNYVIFGPGEQQYCELRPGVRSGCPPATYREEFPELWRNVGGRFQNITAESGLGNRPGQWNAHGKALVVAFADYDDCGRMSFYIGNDGTPADLLHNDAHLRFHNTAAEQGVALGVYGQMQASMGADWADFDRDGRMDLVNTGFSDEPYSLYKNRGPFFDNVSIPMGIAEPTRKPLGFGAKFLDADNDGYPDLLFANGHVYDNAGDIDSTHVFREPLLLFRNVAGKRFENVGAAAGEAFSRPILGRGLATADFDNDGRMDALVVDYEGAPLLLHNVTQGGGHWLELRLRGRAPNVFAYGARATLHRGAERWVGEVSPASSYESSSSPVLHFGLGVTARVDRIEVRWSDGNRETFPGGPADRIVSLAEGGGKPTSKAR